jgi:hypothetical protein
MSFQVIRLSEGSVGTNRAAYWKPNQLDLHMVVG